MRPAEAAGLPLHFVLPGRPGLRRLLACRRRAREVAALYPGATCHVWHGAALRKQIGRGSGAQVAAAFDGLPSEADAVALASWCLLHRFGGVFHAPGLRLLAPWTIPGGAGVAGFNDARAAASGWIAIEPALLWSRAGRREWELAVELKVRACGQTPSRVPPDPVILGLAFGQAAVERRARAQDDQWVGQVMDVPGQAGIGGEALVAPDGAMVALMEPTRAAAPHD